MTRGRLLSAAPATLIFTSGLVAILQTAARGASQKDLEILNSAIPHERAAIKAYQDSAATGLLSAGVLEVAKGFMSDHMAHRDALIAAVKAGGGVPTEATTKVTYPELKSQADILRFAESLEKGAASAYLAAFTKLEDKDLAKAAVTILGVETMHAGILASALGEAAPYKGFVS
jgi:hypothetical protein